HINIVRLLLNCRHTFKFKDNASEMALYIALKTKHHKIAKLIRDLGVEGEICNSVKNNMASSDGEIYEITDFTDLRHLEGAIGGTIDKWKQVNLKSTDDRFVNVWMDGCMDGWMDE
ncbi:hypothetical protein PoB_007528100, partial [Plakobranchus ocellatus]